MIITIYYMTATIFQSWRLKTICSKIAKQLSTKASVVFYNVDGSDLSSTSVSSDLCSNHKQAGVQELLWYNENRRGCSVLPFQRIFLGPWISFPSTPGLIPVSHEKSNVFIDQTNQIFLLIEADPMPNVNGTSDDVLMIENYGEPLAWRIDSRIAFLLKSDINHLAELVMSSFLRDHFLINDRLLLTRIESVDIEGNPQPYDQLKKHSKKDSLSRIYHRLSKVQWEKHLEGLRMLGVLANQAVEFECSTSEGKTTIKPDLISSSNIEESLLSSPIKSPDIEASPLKKIEVSGSILSLTSQTSDRRSVSPNKSEKSFRISPQTTPSATRKSLESVKSNGVSANSTQVKNGAVNASNTSILTATEPVVIEPRLEPRASPEKAKMADPSEALKETPSEALTKAVTEAPTEVLKDVSKEASKEISKEAQKAAPKEDQKPTPSEQTTPKKPMVKEEIKPVEPKPNVPSVQKPTEPQSINGSNKIQAPSATKTSSVTPSSTESGAPRPSLKRTKKGGTISAGKPPNILVYSESNTTKENVVQTLKNVLEPDMYTIYPLGLQDVKHTAWIDQTILLVVCGNVPNDISKTLLEYFIKGGKMLCLCSDLLHIILPTFRMAEVREHELVQFTYGKWKQVRMMHHIFCYQPSPVKKQFSSVDGEDIPPPKQPTNSVVPRTVEVKDLEGVEHSLYVQVLGQEETWNTPSLMVASNPKSSGKAVFSQIHLEIDPNLYENDEPKFLVLKQNDKYRLEILTDLLSSHLGLSVDSSAKKSTMQFKNGFFLGRHEGKLELLEKLKPLMSEKNTLDNKLLTLKFFGKNETPDTATEKSLPILIHSCPDDFSTVEYFDNLKTEKIGRLVIYTPIVASSMHVINNLTLEHGLAVIPRKQTNGNGRHKNTWLSPDGCLMFSLQLHIPLASPLGQRVSLVQHLIALAVVKSILNQPGYEELDIALKWPNDIYANGGTKIGGNIINSVIQDSLAICNIGVGINLSNSSPTVCINDLIKESNLRFGKKVPNLTYEKTLANIFSEIENLYNRVQTGDFDSFFKDYYTHWLHSDVEITILDRHGYEKRAKIIGIDEYGYLKVQIEGQTQAESVHPDGNSFDMFHGLILPKI